MDKEWLPLELMLAFAVIGGFFFGSGGAIVCGIIGLALPFVWEK